VCSRKRTNSTDQLGGPQRECNDWAPASQESRRLASSRKVSGAWTTSAAYALNAARHMPARLGIYRLACSHSGSHPLKLLADLNAFRDELDAELVGTVLGHPAAVASLRRYPTAPAPAGVRVAWGAGLVEGLRPAIWAATSPRRSFFVISGPSVIIVTSSAGLEFRPPHSREQ
jgi:hypothetical protein